MFRAGQTVVLLPLVGAGVPLTHSRRHHGLRAGTVPARSTGELVGLAMMLPVVGLASRRTLAALRALGVMPTSGAGSWRTTVLSVVGVTLRRERPMSTLAALPRDRSGPAQTWLLHATNLLYIAIVVGSWALAGSSQGASPAWLEPGLAGILAQLGFFLLPALAFVWLTHQPPREALKLSPLGLGSAMRCFLVGLLSWAGFVFCSNLTTLLLVSLQLPGAGQAPVAAGSGGTPWALLVLVVAVAPLCEELLFRGVLLHAYEPRVGAHAIWLVALLFALVHLSVDQVLGALFVGLIAGWVVYQTRSLWAGVLVHLGANLLSALLLLLLSLAAPGEVAEAAQGAAPAGDLFAMLLSGVLLWGAITAVLLVPMFFLLRSLGRRYPTPAPIAAQLDLNTLWSFVLALTVAAALLALGLFR